MVDQTQLIQSIQRAFEASRNPTIAKWQGKYMKDLFPFFGIQKPVRAVLQKELLKATHIREEKELFALVELLWEKQEREFHYFACDLCIKSLPICSANALDHLEKMIRKHSWWDSVDTIAAHLVGPFLQRYPERKKELDRWIDDPHLWIRRSALIFQLRYKQETDHDLLFAYVKKRMGEKEFFIRKAIGWALREYAKTDPKKVMLFVKTYSTLLSPLSVREATRRLLKVF